MTCGEPEGTQEGGVEEGGQEGVVRGEEVAAGEHGGKACETYGKAAVGAETELGGAKAGVGGEAEEEEDEGFEFGGGGGGREGGRGRAEEEGAEPGEDAIDD